MKCCDCSFFKIQYDPIGKINTGLWDFGRARCEKHDLIVDFASKRKLKELVCVEEVKPELAEEDADGRAREGC